MLRTTLAAATAAAALIVLAGPAAPGTAQDVCVRVAAGVTATNTMVGPNPVCAATPFATQPLRHRYEVGPFGYAEVAVTYP